jgi:hypothetical protein
MPLVVQAVLVMGYVLTQMLAVAIGGGVVMVLTTVIIGMMTICTATAIGAKMKILPMRQLSHQYQSQKLLHMHWLELQCHHHQHHHHHQHQQHQQINQKNKYVTMLVTKNAPMFLRNPQLVLAAASDKATPKDNQKMQICWYAGNKKCPNVPQKKTAGSCRCK